MPGDLDEAISRLDIRVDMLEMKMNSATRPSTWPTRGEWRALLSLCKTVVEKYEESNAQTRA